MKQEEKEQEIWQFKESHCYRLDCKGCGEALTWDGDNIAHFQSKEEAIRISYESNWKDGLCFDCHMAKDDDDDES